MNELISVRVDDTGKLNTDISTKPHRKGMALLIPTIEGQPYAKSTTEAAVNTMWRMTASLRPNKSRVTFEEAQAGKTDDDIHENMMVIIKDMANLMQKMVHSASWRDGEFHDFDRHEFSRQLNMINKRL